MVKFKVNEKDLKFVFLDVFVVFDRFVDDGFFFIKVYKIRFFGGKIRFFYIKYIFLLDKSVNLLILMLIEIVENK